MDIKDLKLNIEQKVLGKKRVIIVPHNRIDFDAIGSALGLATIIKRMNVEPLIVVNDDISKMQKGIQIIVNDVKSNYKLLTREEYLEQASDDDLFVLTDVNKRGMVSISDKISDPENTIIIDHHDTDDTSIESNYKYIDEGVSSASEIVATLMSMYRTKWPTMIANYLLAGIYLDTNHMSKNVSGSTFSIAGKLAGFGANPNRVNDLFLEDFESDRRVQELVNRVQISTYTMGIILAEEGKIYNPEELAKAADYLLKYGVDGAFAVGRVSEDVVHISARSLENINVGEVMKSLGGGGNPASGAVKIEGENVLEVGKKLRKVLEPTGYNRHI